MITIELPIYWTQHYKTKADKTVLVGMNWYRNAHYHAQNAMKKDFQELVSKQLDGTSVPGEFTLEIKIYYKNSNCDGSNIAALIEKVVLDALQEEKAVVNDNVKYHLGTTWKVATQTKDNPRAVITVNMIN